MTVHLSFAHAVHDEHLVEPWVSHEPLGEDVAILVHWPPGLDDLEVLGRRAGVVVDNVVPLGPESEPASRVGCCDEVEVLQVLRSGKFPKAVEPYELGGPRHAEVVGVQWR